MVIVCVVSLWHGAEHMGNIAFDRSLCWQLPEYDANYKGYGQEDVDFSYQLYLQGYKFCFCKDTVNYHQEHLQEKERRKRSI